MKTAGFSHSEIPGSKRVCRYPRLIAASHVLHRLTSPRHSPIALASFVYDSLNRRMVFIPDERHLCHPFYVKTIKELKVI